MLKHAVITIWFGFAAMLRAQDDPGAKFKVETNLVNVTFTVHDKNGALQRDLTRDDFTVLEDGVKQEVRFFSKEQETPLTLGFIVDLSGSQSGLFKGNAEAANQFFRQIIRPNDVAFVAAFRVTIKLIHDFTASVNELSDAVVDAADLFRNSPPLTYTAFRGGSPVRDTIYFSAQNKLKQREGRKAIIIISDGEDNASRHSLIDTIEMVESVDAVFYALNSGHSAATNVMRYAGPSAAARSLLTRSHMDRIAKETGGEEFKVSKVNLEDTFKRIEEELRTTYTVGYVPSNPAMDGKFRKIQIKTKPDLIVRAREGYRAAKPN